ncbi:(2Fe-2S) ferredoxin domain-containing protein [Sphingomonas sp. MMS24-J13]|uniref:(2Fe-2S) ferredoxin domain-containing protein n=1 Tax=Sphingomonas sp. MMS24-J13 TaxID=3238686 RepID=UPI00384D118B
MAKQMVKADWQAAIIVCAKCTRRIGGGFGEKERTSLIKALRKLGNRKKGRKANLGLVETGCLKICPKNAVVAINGARPRDWIIIPRGTSTSDAAAMLGLSPQEAKAEHQA